MNGMINHNINNNNGMNNGYSAGGGSNAWIQPPKSIASNIEMFLIVIMFKVANQPQFLTVWKLYPIRHNLVLIVIGILVITFMAIQQYISHEDESTLHHLNSSSIAINNHTEGIPGH